MKVNLIFRQTWKLVFFWSKFIDDFLWKWISSNLKSRRRLRTWNCGIYRLFASALLVAMKRNSERGDEKKNELIHKRLISNGRNSILFPRIENMLPAWLKKKKLKMYEVNGIAEMRKIHQKANRSDEINFRVMSDFLVRLTSSSRSNTISICSKHLFLFHQIHIDDAYCFSNRLFHLLDLSIHYTGNR